MAKTCSFPACHNGSLDNRRTNKTKNNRNKSLFKFPKKGLPQRKQWEEVIGRPAKDHDVICEDHFPSDKIIRDFKIVLPNGRVDIIKRGVSRLHPDSVPLPFVPIPLPEHNYAKPDDDDDDDDIHIIEQIKPQKNENTVVNQTSQNNNNNNNNNNNIQKNITLNNKKNVNNNQQTVNGNQTNNLQPIIQLDKNQPPPVLWHLPISNNLNSQITGATLTPIQPVPTSFTVLVAKELTPPTKKINKKTELPKLIQLPPASTATVSSIAPSPITAIVTTPKTVPTSTAAPKTLPATTTTTTPLAITKKQAPRSSISSISSMSSITKNKIIQVIEKPEKWSLDKLYNELSIVYDDKMKWGVIRLDNKISIIVFDNLIQPKKQMIIYNDLTYEVRVNHRKTFVPGLKENSSLNNAIHNIRILHKLIPCDGPGGGESPALTCCGYATIDGLRIRFGHLRCQSCNELRKKILRKRAYDIKVEKRLHDKVKNLRRTLKLTKAKLKRLRIRFGKKDSDEIINSEESELDIEDILDTIDDNDDNNIDNIDDNDNTDNIDNNDNINDIDNINNIDNNDNMDNNDNIDNNHNIDNNDNNGNNNNDINL